MDSILKRGILVAGALICLSSTSLLGVESFVIDTKEEWEQWIYPGGGVVEITDDGWVKVGSVEKNINACIDAHTFTYDGHTGTTTGGIRAVGSNPSDAKNIMDGDSTTFWAPHPDDDLEDWWIEVDLGRVVTSKKLRLVFAEDRVPFPGFEIYVSDGEPKFPGTKIKILKYEPVAKTAKPNREYVFEHNFDSEKDLHGNPLSGKFVHYVKIFFTQKVEGAGLAELEVISLGKNIALRTIARGGSSTSGQVSLPFKLYDGRIWTGWRMTRMGDDWLQGVNGPWVRWDLGTQFWVDTIKLTTGAMSGWGFGSMDGFKIYVSDGTGAIMSKPEVWQVDGRNLKWDKIVDVNNTLVLPSLYDFEFTFSPPKRMRYIFFHHFYGQGYWRTGYAFGPMIYEFQLFGEGFIPGVTLKSPLIDLGMTKNMTSISWRERTPPGTRVEIRTRTGDEVEEVTHWYDVNGKEVTEKEYNRIPRFRRGPVVKEQVPDERYWSGWSEVYDHPGVGFASPSPRRYLLIEVKLLSDDPKVAPSLDSITLFHTKPAVKTLFGEIKPKSARPGLPQFFRFSIRPIYASGTTGFNRVLIRTPSTADSVEVRVGGREVEPVFEAKEDSLLIRLPSMVRRQEVEISFRCTPFFNSTVFDAFVSGIPGSWQRVDPDPSKRGATTVMLSLLAETEELIGNLSIEPGVITPNGDLINDELAVKFTVFKVDVPRKISVEIYDLSGRLVKELYSEFGASGNYGYGGEILWDGQDGSGEKVLPGVYVCQVKVDTDVGETTVNRTLVVAY